MRNKPFSYYLFWVIFSPLVLICNQAWRPGFFPDGNIYANLGKNIARTGDWLNITFSQHYFPKFFEHPPLLFWIEGITFKLFGESWLVARLTTSMFSVATCVILFVFLYKKVDLIWALFASLSLSLTPMFINTSTLPYLDPLLTFFTTLALLSYWNASEEQNQKKKLFFWLISGIGFGLALLTKGPPAFAIGAIIFFHILWNKQQKTLLSFHPYLAFIIGLGLFSLWPLALYKTGNFEGFEYFLDRQIFQRLKGGNPNAHGFRPFYYFKVLLENGPWFPIALLGGWLMIKNQEFKSLSKLALLWFLCFLIPFSLTSWQYSHYILAIYPAMAIFSGYSFNCMKQRWKDKCLPIFQTLILIATLVILIFPVTIKSRRTKELFTIQNQVELLPKPPKIWILQYGAYGDWQFNSFVGWSTDADPFVAGHQGEKDFLKDIEDQMDNHPIILLLPEMAKKLEKKFPNQFFQLLKLPNQNLVVVSDIRNMDGEKSLVVRGL